MRDQGVLFLNESLSAEAKALHWRPIVQKLIATIIARRKQNQQRTLIYNWGKKAKTLQSYVLSSFGADPFVRIQSMVSPGHTSGDLFENVFQIIDKDIDENELSPIDWTPRRCILVKSAKNKKPAVQ